MEKIPQNYKIVEDNYLGQENLYKIKVDGCKWPIVAYIPENANSDTAIHFHFKGSGKTGDINNTATNIAEYGGNSIVLMPNVHYSSTDALNDATIKAVKAMQKEYGMATVKMSTDGWSGGTYGALETFVESSKQGIEFEGTPMIHFLDDSSSLTHNDKNSDKSRTYILEHGGAEAIAKHRPIMISYFSEPEEATKALSEGNLVDAHNLIDKQFGKRDKAMIDYANAGAICLRARITNPNGHEGIKNNMHMAGVQDFNGRESILPDESQDDWLKSTGGKAVYTYELLIGTDENGKGIWEKVPYNYVATKSGIIAYAYLRGFKSGESDAVVTTLLKNLDLKSLNNGVANLSSLDINLLSDSEVVAVCVNSILNSISSSSIVQNGGSSSGIGFSGDSSVPTAIPTIIQEYFSANTELMFKISSDMNSITKIAYSIEVMDFKMADEANDANMNL